MFKKSVFINCKLSKEEVIDALEKHVEQFHKDNSVCDFEGKINSDGTFLIKPTFDFGPRNQFRPEINGVIKDNKIDIEFTINSFIKKIFISILLIEILFIIVIYINSRDERFILFFPFFAVFVIFLKFTFNNKVHKSIDLLESYFK